MNGNTYFEQSIKKAAELERQATALRKASAMIARIIAKRNPSVKNDGHLYDLAVQTLKNLGITAPDSGLLCWVD